MALYTLKRLGVAILVAIAVSLVTFSLLYVSGDPAAAMAGESASEEDIEYVRKHYGFDRPLTVQYIDWAYKAIHGDFGMSIYLKRPVAEILAERAPTTMTLGALALGFALVLAIPLGVLAAMFPNTIIDRLALSLAVVGQALPSFFFALIMIIIFGVWLRWLPISGHASWLNFIMPSIALGYYATPAIMRLTRAGMMEVLSSDYIRTARAKGFRGWSLLRRHALRNAILPVISVLAVQLGQKFGGSVITESIFAINGLGRLALESILGADIPTVQMLIFVFAIVFVAMNLLADILNAALDPRIRIG